MQSYQEKCLNCGDVVKVIPCYTHKMLWEDDWKYFHTDPKYTGLSEELKAQLTMNFFNEMNDYEIHLAISAQQAQRYSYKGKGEDKNVKSTTNGDKQKDKHAF